MSGIVDQISIRDAIGDPWDFNIWDFSGLGTGPWAFMNVLSDGASGELAKAEDAAHVSGDKGILALVVRKDSAAPLAGSDGDYTGLIVDANGKLWVSAVISAGSGATDLGKAEDAVHGSGDVGIMSLAVRKDTAASLAGSDGDYIPLIVDSTGRLWTHVGAIEAGANIIGKVGIDQTTPGTTDSVTVKGQGFKGSATFTPAASSHAAGDCNGAAADLSLSPAPPSGSVIMITDAEVEIDGGTAEATAWRLYLYNVTPPSATADDGAWDLPSGDRASFLGYIDLGTAVDLGSTQWVETHGINKALKLSGTTVFGYLVNLSTLTPANVGHIVKLYGVVL